MITFNDQNAAIRPVSAGTPSGLTAHVRNPARFGLRDWGAWALVLNGVLVALYLICVPFPRGTYSPLAFLDQIGQSLLWIVIELQLVLAIVAWRASAAADISPRRKLGWRFFALACFVYWAGNVWYTYLALYNSSAAFPSLADAGYLAFYPLAFAGLICFTEKPDRKLDQTPFWLDAATVVVGIGTLVWYFLLQPLAQARYNSSLELVLTLAYPVCDTLLVFGITVNLLRYRRGRSGQPLAWLVAGMLVHFAADTSFAYQSLQGTYAPGGVVGTLYVVAYFFMLVAAHLEYRLASRKGTQEVAQQPVHRFSHLPYASVALAYGLLLYVSHGDWETPLGGVIVAAVTLTALVVARQLISIRENVRLRSEQAARETEARFASMVRHSSDVISLLDSGQAIRFVSPSAARVYGYEPQTLQATPLLNLIHPEDRPRAQNFLNDALCAGRETTTSAEWRLLHGDGRWRDIETVATNLTDDPAVGGLVLNSRDVTERRLLEEQLRQQAFHDPLTRLANRTLLRDRVEHALTRISRNDEKVTLLFLDLDNFKAINDSIGHVEGDRLLIATAGRLLQCCRSQDTVARLGGDEFAILIEDQLDLDSVISLSERIAAALAEPLVLGGREVAVTTSIGIAQGAGHDVDALLRNADVAMYTVKNRGKRGHAIFEPGMHAAVIERVDLEADFSKALAREEFRLVYQPVVDLRTGAFAGVEALLRWHHPVRGVVPPSVFIPLAEENGELIVAIGRWVLREACRQGRAWQDRCPPGMRLHVAVNISVRQFQHSDLAQEVAEALAEFDLDPRFLILEITESAMMKRTDAMLRTLNELRASGVRLAIDDFGMGYSSLSYLHRFPVDILKIDKSFIDHLGKGVEGGGLTSAIVALGQSLRLDTIAEGVEHAAQADDLLKLGCHLAQGYHFSRPVTATEIEAKWLTRTEALPAAMPA